MAHKWNVAKEITDGKIYSAAKNSRKHQQAREIPDVQRAERRKRACRKQQRIARQERHNDQTSLHENYGEQNTIGPRTVLGNYCIQIFIQMQEQVNQKSY